MYRIEDTDYGFKLTFADVMDRAEAQRWLEEIVPRIDSRRSPFSIFVDMRTLSPLSEEARGPIITGQRHARKKGLIRSVVILKDNLTTLQFIRIGKDTGIQKHERYISAIDNADWERQGLDWILEGIEPSR